MAIARGAGTEIIRCASFRYVASNQVAIPLLIGVQHHVYTILSVVVHAIVGDSLDLEMFLTGYDSNAATTAQNTTIFRETLPDDKTFVWNDKFSFNGFEPTDFATSLDDATKQDAVADQGSSVPQKLFMGKGHNGAQYAISLTYIDQNNA